MKEIDQGQQIAAALSYASVAHRQLAFPEKEPIMPDFWPWDKESWRVHNTPAANLQEAKSFIDDELVRLRNNQTGNIIPFK